MDYIASGSYVPRQAVTTFSTHTSGWPGTVKRDRIFATQDSPVAWEDMFGSRAELKAPLLVDAIPPFAEAVAYVCETAESEPAFRRCISVLGSHDEDPDERRKYVAWEYVRFVSELVSRADALGAWGDADLLSFYSELERARFAAVLTGDIVVPIALTALESSTPFELATDLWIEPLAEDLQCARAVSVLGSARVSAFVVAAATHAVVQRNVSFDNSDWVGRRFRQRSVDLSRIERAIECLHVATGRDTGFAQVFARPHDWADDWSYDLPPIWSLSEVHQYPESFDDVGWNKALVRVPSSELTSWPTMVQALEGAPENARLAARRAIRGVLRSDDEDRTIDSTIGIEALLLSNSDRDELTHRMAQRAAAALSSEFRPEIILKLVKEVYAHRSQIVHGRVRTSSNIRIDGREFLAQDAASFLLRMLLTGYLTSEAPWSPDELDAQLLRGLSRQVDEVSPEAPLSSQ
ncbi:MAG: hypothetical protein ACYC90_05080 [Candidatus Nanopelagicales bacterium]